MVVPYSAYSLNKFGLLLKSSGRIDEAAKHFEKALNLKHKYTFAREKYLKRLRCNTSLSRRRLRSQRVDVGALQRRDLRRLGAVLVKRAKPENTEEASEFTVIPEQGHSQARNDRGCSL